MLPSSDTGKQSLFVVFGLQEFGDFELAYYLPSNHTDVRSFESFAFESYQGFTTYDDTQQIQADGFKPVVFDPAEHLLPEAPATSTLGQEWGDSDFDFVGYDHQSSLNVPASDEAYVNVTLDVM